ncbi:MAG: hypothetical protein PHO86_02470 [Bacilli bacterium]|nr:hypothetical protein [Bacilli bacterium]
MKLIRRFSSGLFSPGEIFSYQSDSRWLTFLYTIILVLLMALPNLVTLNKNTNIDYEDKLELRETFFHDGTEIPYYIKHNQLFHDTGNTGYIYSKTLSNGFVVKFTLGDNIQVDSATTPTIVFTKNGVVFIYSIYNDILLTYDDYPELEDLDFSGAYNDDDAFWGTIFPIISNKLDSYKPVIITANVVVAIIGALGSILIWSLIISVFQKINIGSKIKFSKLWQMMMYIMITFVIGSLLADLFGSILLYYGGFILMVANSAKLGQAIIIGGEKNEL